MPKVGTSAEGKSERNLDKVLLSVGRQRLEDMIFFLSIHGTTL